jgi:hypothetical protein
MKSLDQIANAAHENARQKGFHPKRVKRKTDDIFLSEQLMNLVCEIAELWEAHRNGGLHDLCDKAEKMAALGLPPLTCIEEEYADIIIRALDQCRRLKVDIQRAIEIKHSFNTTRPHLHGKRN